MTLQNVGICITAIISTFSLIISIANYWKSKPKLRIEITDKNWDGFFGRVIHEGKYNHENFICGAKINIINNSPVAITISNANMIIDKEHLRFIDNRNKFWECAEFYFEDDNGELTTDGSGIYYKECGLSLPLKVSAYDTITAFLLFHDFPIKYKNKCTGKLLLHTAIGKVKKKIRLVEYDKNYQEEGYRYYLQYCRSLGEN